MICKKLDMFPVECIARGYLTGSGLLEYRQSGTVCSIPLPEGLVDGSASTRPSSRRRRRPRWASTTRTSPTTPSWTMVGEEIAAA